MSEASRPLTPDRIESAMGAYYQTLGVLRRRCAYLSRKADALAQEPEALADQMDRMRQILTDILVHNARFSSRYLDRPASEAEAWLRRHLDGLTKPPDQP